MINESIIVGPGFKLPTWKEIQDSKNGMRMIIRELFKSGKSVNQVYAIGIQMGLRPETMLEEISMLKDESSAVAPSPDFQYTPEQVSQFLTLYTESKKTNLMKNLTVADVIEKIDSLSASLAELKETESLNHTVSKIQESVSSIRSYLDKKLQSIQNLMESYSQTLENSLKLYGKDSKFYKNLTEKLEKEIDSLNRSAEVEKIRVIYFLESLSTFREILPVKSILEWRNFVVNENWKIFKLFESYLRLEGSNSSFNDSFARREIVSILEKQEITSEDITKLSKFRWVKPIENFLIESASYDNTLIAKGDAYTVEPISYIVETNEGFIFRLDGRNFILESNSVREYTESVEDNFFVHLNEFLSSNVRRNEDDLVIYHNNKKLSINLKENKISIGSISSDIKDTESVKRVIRESMFVGLRDRSMMDSILYLIERLDKVVSLDFVTSIYSHKDPKVKVNFIKFNESMIVNRISSFLKKNDVSVVESATVAQTLIDEYIKFDISNSVKDLLESEKLESLKKQEEIAKITDDLKFLEEKKNDIEIAMKKIGEESFSDLKEAIDLLDSEISRKNVELQELILKK